MLKLAFAALFTVYGFSSVSLAYLEDHFECHSVQDRALRMNPSVTFHLDLVNRPDIELQNYDSARFPDSAYGREIRSALHLNGRKVPTQVKSLSVQRGHISNITRPGAGGKVCIIGNYETNIQYLAAVKVGAVAKQVRFVCTNTSKLPDETMYCE